MSGRPRKDNVLSFPKTWEEEKENPIRRRWLAHEYSLDWDQYFSLLERQNFQCAICKEDLIPGDSHVDHCHDTDLIRGVLCRRCNRALGLLKDNEEILQQAIEYLRNNAQLEGTYKKMSSNGYFKKKYDSKDIGLRYLTGESSVQIARSLNTKPSIIFGILKREKIPVRKTQGKRTPEVDKQVCDLFLSGVLVRNIVQIVPISRSRIYSILEENNISTKKSKR